MEPASKLNQLLAERRFDQKEVAAAAQISYGTFRSYLKPENAAIPAADTGVKIAKALSVPAEWLWSDANWPPPDPHKSSVSGVPSKELVDELARRRDICRTELRVIEVVFTPEQLVTLDRSAAKSFASGSQDQALEAAIQLLLQAEFRSRELDWLDPDHVHPFAPYKTAAEIVKDYSYLKAAFNRAMADQVSKMLATPGEAHAAKGRSKVPRT